MYVFNKIFLLPEIFRMKLEERTDKIMIDLLHGHPEDVRLVEITEPRKI